jgi:tetratricopeptide (TPR) repeat protein
MKTRLIIQILLLSIAFPCYGQFSQKTAGYSVQKPDAFNNDQYVTYFIDINKDNIPDKILSSARGMGNELLVYEKKGNAFNLVLKTNNFSEDGGNQVSDIKETKDGFMIVTTFPDRGYYEVDYQMVYQNNSFILKNVIYKTSSWQDDYTKKTVCNVSQNINISKNPYNFTVKGMPDEKNRDRECSTEYDSGKDLQEFADRFKDRNSSPTVQGVERYKQLLQTFPITQQNVQQYNDIGYYLQQSGNNKEAVFLLTRILEKFPTRVVACLNLADAYWEIKDTAKAKEYYQKYVSLMKTQAKDLKKIPQRVYDRSK